MRATMQKILICAVLLAVVLFGLKLIPDLLRPAPQIRFGIGPVANSASKTRLVAQSPVRMLSTWYNAPADLTWVMNWKHDLVTQLYAANYSLHVIVFTDGPEVQISTAHGSACGRAYPLSDRFLADMRLLADTFAGAPTGPPLYITLFTEFQTYACVDNAWNPDAPTNAYYRALKDRYLEALAVFHQHAPNAHVSLGWGGWQARWDDPSIGAGRSMFDHFADVMRASDFQSFQAMQSDSNVADVHAMVGTLGKYGPVMLAHYKPNDRSQATFERDICALLTERSLYDLSTAGLFAWSFMDDTNLSASEDIFRFTQAAVRQFGAEPAGQPRHSAAGDEPGVSATSGSC
jgi:hypothetical protein